LIIAAIGFLILGFIIARIRSQLHRDKLLDAAAQREKHAPKTVELPTALYSSGRRIQESESPHLNESEETVEPIDSKATDQPDELKETVEPIDSKATDQPDELKETVEPIDSKKSEEDIRLESSSRQINELSDEEREKYDARDQARDENIMLLRLLVKELFTEEGPSPGEEFTESIDEESSVELRKTWIQEYEEPLNEHAAFIEQEEIGSGIKMMSPTVQESDDINERLEREGGKSGEVQISLVWDDFNDLDLHLFCPSGERIYFNNKKSACGGELDVDMNVRPTNDNAVENIVWPENAPLGQYKVGVHFYKHHSKNNTTVTCKFRARVKIHGAIQNYSGSITRGQAMQMVTSFTLNQ